ncbi:MAG: LPS export ABC transporter periplasmic protein LptC [Pseudomonadota bacterium]
MHKRTAHRWRLAAIFTIGTFFALGSFWLVQVAHQGEEDVQADARKNEPDYIVEKFSFVRMTPEGAPRYIISGAKLTHHPLDNTADIDAPVMQGMQPKQPPMTMVAKRASIDQTGNRVTLLGSVDLERVAAPGVQHMSLKTEKLIVLPDDDQMETDQQVDMALGATTMRGTGMRANNATRQIHFLSKSEIILPPKTAR